jgi:hypothetical protein
MKRYVTLVWRQKLYTVENALMQPLECPNLHTDSTIRQEEIAPGLEI